MKKTTVFSGAVCAAGVLLLAGGCRSQVMAERAYVPVAENDAAAYAQFGTEAPAPAEAVPAVTAPAEVAPVVPAPVASYPSFESFAGKIPSGSAAVNATGGKYVVKKGDIISRIAHAHGVSTGAMLAANNMTLDDAKKLKIGQTLVIPAPGTKYKKSVTKKAVKKSAAVSDGYYTVKAGDNIPKIARRLKVKASALMAANNLDDAATRRLQIGQKLVIPGRTVSAQAVPANPVPAKVAPVVKPVEKVSDDALAAVDNALNETPETKPEVAAPVADEAVLGGSVPDLVKEPIKLTDYVKAHNITEDVFRKLNGDVVLSEGMIPAGSVVFIPAK